MTMAVGLFRREIGERVVIVPDASTIVFPGGFPRCTGKEGILAAKYAIHHVRRDVARARSASRCLNRAEAKARANGIQRRQIAFEDPCPRGLRC